MHPASCPEDDVCCLQAKEIALTGLGIGPGQIGRGHPQAAQRCDLASRVWLDTCRCRAHNLAATYPHSIIDIGCMRPEFRDWTDPSKLALLQFCLDIPNLPFSNSNNVLAQLRYAAAGDIRLG